MADTKISALIELTAPTADDLLAVIDDPGGTPLSRKVTLANIAKLLGVSKTTLTSAYTNATTTGTEVTGLSFNGLVAGTYFARWMLLYQVPVITTSIKFGVNYSGTVTRMAANVYFPSAGVTAATGTMHNANNATTGQVWAYANTITESTTAPNLGPWIAVTNANVDHLLILEALVVVSDAGDLELWAASEVAATAQLSAGSSGILTRLN